MHIVKSTSEIAALYLKETRRNRYLARADVRGRVLDLPVCPHCERPVLRHKGWRDAGVVQCITPGCGWSGPVAKAFTVGRYLEGGGNGP